MLQIENLMQFDKILEGRRSVARGKYVFGRISTEEVAYNETLINYVTKVQIKCFLGERYKKIIFVNIQNIKFSKMIY